MNLSGATKKEVVDYCRENYQMLLDLVSVARQIYEKSPIRLMAPSEIAFFLYAFEPYEDAVRFMEMVISGIGLTEETPELAMRRILERARFKKDMAITSADLTEYFFVAFGKHQKGEPCHVLRISKRRS